MAISEELFFLDPSFEGTLQKQLQHAVAEGVLSGRFPVGARLPSSRRLAQHLGISRITVTLAYTELVANDYLTARGRSGYFVSETAPRLPEFGDAPPAEDRVDWGRHLVAGHSRDARVARPADWRSYPFPFIYGQTDKRLFDHANWRQCALMALGQRDFSALTEDYYDRDDDRLVEFIARHSLPRRGIRARPEEILVTLGAQNALWIASQVLLGPGRRAVRESPGYPQLRDILGESRADVLTVPVDGRGLIPEAVPAGADVVFATPSHQCPTAATMPMERRRRLLERAAAEDFLVVEDDYEFEMSFLTPPTPALKSIDRDGRVIYVGSFSKSLFPGLRLGYLVGSAPFIREARALRALMLRHPPGHIQRTVAYFLSLGHYDALIRRMSGAFQQRRAVMEEAIAAHGLQVAGRDALGGSSLWMAAPPHVDTEDLALRLRGEGVLIEPGAAFFEPGARPGHFYRLAYSSISRAAIPEGIARIAGAIARF
ncbi:MocR-like pyridoxine biosynthesis transcription factor PdxR [Mangrovicoccus algicola]|uniref:PLP-dependent aminotransferase family protein n=1 Tax=Mangrovicoccus algicola TaxID=2771008 RepID=A0A8J6Z063_9RHOB|nr:PLP-dependent aminotransferase family protein [Mangrovicoccus algicola]MBE3640054.1 PLP-dependent aminotransferase family protein [Mangrovicoccus algicola]